MFLKNLTTHHKNDILLSSYEGFFIIKDIYERITRISHHLRKMNIFPPFYYSHIIFHPLFLEYIIDFRIRRAENMYAEMDRMKM